MHQFKLTIVLSFLIIIVACKSNKRNVYKESDYTLFKIDSADGIIGTKFFSYNYDTNREMQIDYWNDGTIMAKGFTYKKHIDGELLMYDVDGKLSVIDSFKNGKQVYAKEFHIKDTTVLIFKNGKLSAFKNI